MKGKNFDRLMKCYTIWLLFFFLVFGALDSNAQCSKYTFYATDTVGCENEVISFKISPTPPSGSNADWDFEGSNINNDLTPSHVFTTAGTFDVELELELPSSQKCTVKKADYITIGSKPDPGNLTVTPNIACNIGSQVNIKSSGTNAARFDWTVGGKSYPNAGSSFQHTTQQVGQPDIQLILTGSEGCTSKKTYSSELTVSRKPQVTFPFGDTTFCQYSTVVFHPNVNLYGQTDLKFSWVFNGGSPTGGNKITGERITYNKAGNFDIGLGVFSPSTQCNYNYNFKNIVHSVGTPDIKVKALGINGGNCGNSSFTYSVTPKTLDPSRISWEVFSRKDSFSLDTQDNLAAVVNYRFNGDYTTVFTYQGPGCTKTINTSVTVKKNNINPRFSKDFRCICSVPRTVNFTNNSTHSGTGNLTYEWTLVDAAGNVIETSTSKDFSPTIKKYGEYIMKLRATNDKGCTEEFQEQFEAREFEAFIIPSQNVACPGSEIDFAVADTLCYDTIDVVNWTFYDKDKTSILKTSSDEKTKLRYLLTGLYDVELEVTTKEGCYDKELFEEFIEISPLDGLSLGLADDVTCVGAEWTIPFSTEPENLPLKVSSYLLSKETGDTIRPVKFIPSTEGPKYLTYVINQPGTYDFFLRVISDLCRDSVMRTDFVNVGGVSFELDADLDDDCIPFSTDIYPINVKNHLYGTTDPKLTYLWATATPNRVELDKIYQETANARIFAAGRVDITLSIRNSMGCTSIYDKIRMFDADVEPIFTLPKEFCKGLPLKPQNESRGDLVLMEWSSSTGAIFKPNKNAARPNIEFNTVGVHEITLRVVGKDGCDLTLTKTIDVADFNFDFSVIDNKPKCSPAEFDFSATGTNVDTFFWNFGFGDDIRSTDTSFFKLYDLTTIEPYRNMFDVRLVAKSNKGCIDTLTKKDLIEVRGPVPKFEMINNIGCDPLTVEFVDKSHSVDRLFFSFGDNSSVVTSGYEKHTYTISDSTAAFQEFVPLIVAYDEHDCKISKYADDTIVVYRPPNPGFSVDTTKGCAPAIFRFTDTSTYTKVWTWDFNNDGIVDDSTRNPKPALPAGTYDVRLTVFNEIGCEETVLKRGLLTAWPTPIARFRADTIICTDLAVEFTDFSEFPYPASSWEWDFGDVTIETDTSTKQNPAHKYNQEGLYSIRLIVVDKNNCSDTLIKRNHTQVYDKLPLSNITVEYITITDNDELVIKHAKAPDWAFDSYVVMNGQTGQQLTKTLDVADTAKLFVDLPVNEGVQCLHYILNDICFNVHEADDHCTIFLEVDEQEKRRSDLTWTPYVGWEAVDKYLIYRSDVTKPNPYLIDSVAGDVTSYSDSIICDLTYTYKVVAKQANGSYESQSNKVSHTPEYIFQEKPLRVELVTVDENNHLLITWEKSVQENASAYILDRTQEFSPWKTEMFRVTDTFVRDSKALVDHRWYMYRVSVVDACGYQSMIGPVGKSIFLQHRFDNSHVRLFWNHYRDWENGVKAYEIYRNRTDDKEELFKLISLPPNDSSYLDTGAFRIFDKPFEYQIRAIENADKPDTSYSNIRPVKPLPTIFGASAFTPNNDGVNDTFLLKGMGIKDQLSDLESFELQIFNRWGERMYWGHNIAEGWDGTFNGRECPPAVYVWIGKATGRNGETIFLQGNLTLIR